MGREVRMVPPTWEHPRDSRGGYVPMLQYPPTYEEEEIKEGLREGWLVDSPPNYGCSVMPQWPDEECTHFQMYETTSEGTPRSPPMPTAEELAHWLVDNSVSSFADQTSSYTAWLRVCQGGWAPSAAIQRGDTLMSGVTAMGEDS